MENKECESIRIDDEGLLSSLNEINFEISNKDIYMKETLLSNYINNIFKSISNIEEYFKKAKNEVESYIDCFINIPLPNDINLNTNKMNSLKAIVNVKDKINVYENNDSNNIVSTIKNGEMVNIIEYKSDNKYAKIELNNGNIAYIDKNSISLI